MSTHTSRHLSERDSLSDLAAFTKRIEDERARVQEEYSAKWTAEKRAAAVKSGDALPGGKFPIKDQEDMNNAAGLIGNSTVAKTTVVAHMRKQAKKHGLTLPKSLQSNSTGS